MKIIFLKDSPGQGRKGEVKEVSEGFGRNFLISKGLAQIVTPELQAKLQKESKESAEKVKREEQKSQTLKNELEKRIFKVGVKVGDKGQVFGSVHEKEIAEAINEKTGTEINRDMVEIPKPIKSLGEHVVEIKLSPKIKAKTKIMVEAK